MKLAGCGAGLDLHVEHKLWAVAFILALLKARLDFFHGRMDGAETLGNHEGNPLNSTSSVNHHRAPSSWAGLRKFFSFRYHRAPLPPVTPLINVCWWKEKGNHTNNSWLLYYRFFFFLTSMSLNYWNYFLSLRHIYIYFWDVYVVYIPTKGWPNRKQIRIGIVKE